MAQTTAQALEGPHPQAQEFVVVYANQKPSALPGKATVLEGRSSFQEAKARKNQLAADDPWDLRVYAVQHAPTGRRIGKWKRAHGKFPVRFHTRRAVLTLTVSSTSNLSDNAWAEEVLLQVEKSLATPKGRRELTKALRLERG